VDVGEVIELVSSSLLILNVAFLSSFLGLFKVFFLINYSFIFNPNSSNADENFSYLGVRSVYDTAALTPSL
jgi:hypothetical protein